MAHGIRTLLTVLFLFASGSLAATATVYCDQTDSASVFAGNDLVSALREKGYSVSGLQSITALAVGPENIRCVLSKQGASNAEAALRAEGGLATTILKPQAYSSRITTSGVCTTYWIIGADAAGVMYGGLDIAHSIRIDDPTGIANGDHAPYLLRRGLLYSIPLDARTPNYGAAGDVFSDNIEVMWDINFWKEFLDDLARDHINVVYLWTQNPFPVLVKVPEYPSVSLNDVLRPTVPFNGTASGRNLTPPAMLASARKVKTMTIDDKIAFWRQVMEYGRNRGVSFSLCTFNIHLYSMENKYGFSKDKNDPETMDYFRKAVRTMVQTYPLLDGIGAYIGEDMDGYSTQEKWDWVFNTHGKGIMDAKAAQPDRKIGFLARVFGGGDIQPALSTFSSYPDTVVVASRYATNIYTTATPHSWDNVINAVPNGKQAWLELRNESFFVFRFGDYEFMRSLMKNIPLAKTYGILWGSNGYMYGREFMSTEPENPPQLMTKKMWYHFMLLGRLAYDPDLPASLFQKTLAYKFPRVSSSALFAAWAAATGIIPLVNRFHFTNIGDADFKWYPEACMNNDVNKIGNLINSHTVDAATLMDIGTYRDRFAAGQAMGSAATPPQTAKKLKDYADAALGGIAGMDPGDDRELRMTLGDIRAMAYLGHYYSEKILGATDKAIYDKNNVKYASYKDSSLAHLKSAAAHWRTYATAFSQQYLPQWFSRIGHADSAAGYVDVKKLFSTPLADLAQAGGSAMDASATPTEGGSRLQAGAAKMAGGMVAARLGVPAAAFANASNGTLQWAFDAPAAGSYRLEIRYSIDTGEAPASLSANGADAGPALSFWTTGGSWQIESRSVYLPAGLDTIKLALSAKGPVYIDYLNVVYQPSVALRSKPAAARLQAVSLTQGMFEADLMLAEPADVVLRIFDLRGRTALLRMERKQPGTSRFSASLAALPPKPYAAVLSCNGVDLVKKFFCNP